ncbi:unnamed protein product [Camellia sinensis]
MILKLDDEDPLFARLNSKKKKQIENWLSQTHKAYRQSLPEALLHLNFRIVLAVAGNNVRHRSTDTGNDQKS